MQPIDKRRTGLIAVIALVVLLAWQTPSANLEIRMHDVTDAAPHKVEAALNLGVAAVSLLVTWSGDR